MRCSEKVTKYWVECNKCGATNRHIAIADGLGDGFDSERTADEVARISGWLVGYTIDLCPNCRGEIGERNEKE